MWGAADPSERGPVIASTTDFMNKNAIGTHNGAYSTYRAVALAAGRYPAGFKPDLTNTQPVVHFPPRAGWTGASRIVSIDPWGHLAHLVFKDMLVKHDIRPTISITKAHISLKEIEEATLKGRIRVDGEVMRNASTANCTKIAFEHVWHLPGIAQRFGVEVGHLRRCLFEETGGMFPELITRTDLDIFLPPIGGVTVYIFGDPAKLGNKDYPCACRVHDECNGSDVFGSDICTCRPYLTHGIEVCIDTAQRGGVGVIAYYRKEGRALGEVTKFLVYNARKRQEGGDRAETYCPPPLIPPPLLPVITIFRRYFLRTECVAGVQDMRFQELMPDILVWLGIERIDKLVSMSDMKHDAITGAGIEVVERIQIPDDMIPSDAHVEIDAKKAAGYFSTDGAPTEEELKQAKGRGFEKY